MNWYVWQNDFGSLSVDNTEHGHYASTCLGTFNTRQEAEEFCVNYIDPADEAGSLHCPICGSLTDGTGCRECDSPKLSDFVGW